MVHLAVFVAALIQATTGLGFGLLAGPVLMLAMGDASAIQTSIVLSLLIALILAPKLHRQADRPMLRDLLIGTVLGLPIGIYIYLHAELGSLELMAGLTILIMGGSALPALRAKGPASPGARARSVDIAVGGLCGIMTASLAMPGPAPGALMAARAYSKNVIRSTMLTLFVPAYALALLLQISVATVTLDTWWTTATLVPATLVGLVCGKVLASRIDEKVFRLCLSILLLCTAAGLLTSGVGRFLN